MVVGALGLLAAAAAMGPWQMGLDGRLGSHLVAGALGIASLSVVEILIAIVPLRRGEVWAFWAAAVPIVLVGIPVTIVDAVYVPAGRLIAVLVPQVLGLAVWVAGLTLCGLSLFAPRPQKPPETLAP